MPTGKAGATGIFSSQLSRRALILGAVAAALIIIVTLSIAPFGRMAGAVFPPFALVYAVMMCVMSALIAYFFALRFRDRRHPVLGALAGGFGYVAVLAFSQSLAFPGVISATKIFSGGAQSSVWMWVLWHAGFPIFILIGLCLDQRHSPDGTVGPIHKIGLALIPGGPVIAVVAVYFCLTQSQYLPPLVSGLRYEGLRQSLVVPLIIGVTLLALIACTWTTKLRDLLSLWLAIALLASLSDAILTLSGASRYDLGWYAGRMLSIIATSSIFCVFMYEFSRLYGKLTQANRELGQRVCRDGLTGSFNRRYFSEQFPQEMLRAQRDGTALSLLMIDVDNFKIYNDLYGHQQGDTCLIRVVDTIQGFTQRPGDITARYGGEEFIILLPKTDVFGARMIAEKIRSAVAALEFWAAEGSVHTVTISIGVETFNPATGSLSPEEFLKRADLALYQAKYQGRNVVRVYEHYNGPLPVAG